jgi:hypothetical protein
MSVYPAFLQHIHDMGIYVVGYNYEEMYNIMVYSLTNNLPLTNNFIFTHNQMNELYEYLDELLYAPPTDSNQSQDQDTIYPEIQTQNQNQDIIYPNINDQSINQAQDTIQLFNAYLLHAINNQYSNTYTNNTHVTNMNTMNNLNDQVSHTDDEIYHNDDVITYTNLVYYDNSQNP